MIVPYLWSEFYPGRCELLECLWFFGLLYTHAYVDLHCLGGSGFCWHRHLWLACVSIIKFLLIILLHTSFNLLSGHKPMGTHLKSYYYITNKNTLINDRLWWSHPKLKLYITIEFYISYRIYWQIFVNTKLSYFFRLPHWLLVINFNSNNLLCQYVGETYSRRTNIYKLSICVYCWWLFLSDEKVIFLYICHGVLLVNKDLVTIVQTFIKVGYLDLFQDCLYLLARLIHYR